MFTDKHGKPIPDGAYVHYKRAFGNPNRIPDRVPAELDGWAFRFHKKGGNGEIVLGLFTNDPDNNMYYTGLYYDDDGEACEDLELEGIPA